jgi:alpha-D-ribose 1-methylphosphonate 5-triphosphate synthase subunit PhnG
MENKNHTSASTSARAGWISLLAKAPGITLSEAVKQYGELPQYEWLRRPETGLAMVRARAGGTGRQFNLGEMSVTRCAVRLGTGQMGVAYVAGRNARHAELAAVFDALMQTRADEKVRQTVLRPIELALAEKLVQTQAQAQATKVEFMTMVRGEDA